MELKTHLRYLNAHHLINVSRLHEIPHALVKEECVRKKTLVRCRPADVC